MKKFIIFNLFLFGFAVKALFSCSSYYAICRLLDSEKESYYISNHGGDIDEWRATLFLSGRNKGRYASIYTIKYMADSGFYVAPLESPREQFEALKAMYEKQQVLFK